MKIGDKVTVIENGAVKLVLLLTSPPPTPSGRSGIPWAGTITTWTGRVFRRRTGKRATLYPLKQVVAVKLPPDEQGVTWVLGWKGEAVNALLAGRALR